ncbi:MAG: cysteine hydrolase [Alphaproteobacteria bacterium]|nr:cysteine hydrolase [Alphaproteobacteria bacterium]
MHNYTIPQWVQDRVIRRQGRLHNHDTIDAARTALVVVDMQNYFVAQGFAAEVPTARGIVPNINRMAKALRTAGGTVVWIQTTATGALETWGNHHKHQMTPERVQKRLTQLDETHDGFKVFAALEVVPGDLRIKKVKYSAFIAGSSDIDAQLKSRGIDTLLITGTVTNVCCESTARDAMMLDYRVVMLSDGNASQSDEEHAASLNNFMIYFGDVMTTDEAAARLVPVTQRKSA